ncbi:MAG: UDP-2,3-diacylglucosamine diphosphatase [Bacteroidales bacterium]|nr:UDP-2,3-diacylglucosamine diphosphatase [Bacteroidales bacterium]
MRDCLYFITDAHLGSGTDSMERERELCHLLDTIEPRCHTLVLLGDMFDFWFTYRFVVPRGHVRLLGKLAELVDKGVQLHFFTGNHDMWLFDYLEREVGAIMHDEPVVMEFGGKRLLVGHGDGLGNTDPAFNCLRGVFHNKLCQRLFAILPSSLTFGIAHRWSDSNKLKHAKQDTLHFMGEEHEEIVMYCRKRMAKEHFDYCVFGHRHTPLKHRLGPDTVYVNVGDWLINRNYAVCLPTGEIQLYNGQQTVEEWC